MLRTMDGTTLLFQFPLVAKKNFFLHFSTNFLFYRLHSKLQCLCSIFKCTKFSWPFRKNNNIINNKN